MPNPYFTGHVMAKYLFGVGPSVLLATGPLVWIGLTFPIVALIIATPSIRIILSEAK